MKIRSLISAAFVLLVLTATLFWVQHRKPTDVTKATADTPPSILKLDEAAITGLEIRKKDAEPIHLVKASSGTWQITQPKSYNADQSTVTGELSTLSSLNSERLVEDKTSDVKQFGLDQPALEIDITDKNNKSQRLLIGDETPTGSAVYAMLAGDSRVFTMASYLKSSVDKSLDDLRDKRLLPVSADKVSRLELLRKNQEIEFGRNQDEWQILKPRPLRADSELVGEMVSKLCDARMDLRGSDSKETAAAFASATQVTMARVTDPSGVQKIEIRKNKDSYYAKSSAVEGVYKVDSSLGQSVDKGLDDFRNKKLFDFGFAEPGKIELHNGSKAYFLTKGGADWWSNGKKMDSSSVQDLIAKLRDLAADKFLDAGFAKPTMEIDVTSNDGKRVEKVSIAKSGNGCIAKRENESTLYQLDVSSVDALQKAADDVKPSTPPAK